jgi:hypothetical protein
MKIDVNREVVRIIYESEPDNESCNNPYFSHLARSREPVLAPLGARR